MLGRRIGPRTPLLLVVLSLLHTTACVTLDEQPSAGSQGSVSADTVSVTPLPDGRLLLTFPPLQPEPSLQRFSVEDARRVLAQFHEDLAQLEPSLIRRVSVGHSSGLQALAYQGRTPAFRLAAYPGPTQPSPLEYTLRDQFTARYGEPLLPLPPCLESSPLLMALRLSPRHMPQGVREGVEELVKDPAFLAGMATALVLYGLAWVAPEPLFTKAFAASVTLVLLSVFSVAELTHFGMVAFHLYQDTQNARSLEEVETAAERFGRYLGGAGVRILAFVAMRGVGRSTQIPQPLGGLWRIWPHRFALPGGYTWSNITLAQSVPTEGALLVTGVAAGSASSTLRSACKELSAKTPGYSRHHLATNKNDDSGVRGGPWTPRFERIFTKAGMGLDDDANKVNLLGHFGPHPEEYHGEIFRRLEDAIRFCKTQQQCRLRLLDELKRIADEI